MSPEQSNGPCRFCGEIHDLGPIGEPGSAFADIRILTCPKIPQDHIYEDVQFEQGPQGRLHRIEQSAEALIVLNNDTVICETCWENRDTPSMEIDPDQVPMGRTTRGECYRCGGRCS